jgi:hypothetical protein
MSAKVEETTLKTWAQVDGNACLHLGLSSDPGDRQNGRATRNPVFEYAGLVFRTKCLAKMAEGCWSENFRAWCKVTLLLSPGDI